MSIENKGVRSLANAQSLVEDENGGQDHCYSEDASGAKPTQGEFEGKGENDERVAKASKATGGRHVTSKNGWTLQKKGKNTLLENVRRAPVVEIRPESVAPKSKK